MEFKPKHTLSDVSKFQKGRTNLGNLILDGMRITGGTDIDWLIERNGGFIVLESKEFQKDHISIPLGQMIAFESLHTKLNSDGKCHFLFFAYDEDIDFSKSRSRIWFFDMDEWKDGKIQSARHPEYQRYYIERDEMKPISLKGFRILMEEFWKEFRKK